MMLSLRELQIFRHIMETGSVTRAAEELRISQPAVSKTLQHVEARLGFKLFVRVRKRLQPTIEAQALLPDTLGAFAAIDVVQRLAVELRTGRSGTLTIGVTPALANSLIPDAVARFRNLRPDIGVVLHVLTAEDIINRIADLRIELGMLIGQVGREDVVTSQLYSSKIFCLFSKESHLANKDVIYPEDIVGEPIISPGKNRPLGHLLAQAFAEKDIPLKIAIEVSHASVATRLAEAGAGIAIIDGFGLKSAEKLGLVSRPFSPPLQSTAKLLEARHRPLSRVAREFRDILKSIDWGYQFGITVA